MICKKIYDWQQLKNEFKSYNRDYYTDKEYSTDELIRINNIVTIRMQMSETIIRNNYYNYLDNKINSYKKANEQKEE